MFTGHQARPSDRSHLFRLVLHQRKHSFFGKTLGLLVVPICFRLHVDVHELAGLTGLFRVLLIADTKVDSDVNPGLVALRLE